MNEEIILSNAFHEAGHCIIAELHSTEFTVRMLSLDEHFLKDKGDNWRGGFGFRFKNFRTNSTDLVEKTVQVYLSGICAATIHERGRKYVNAHLTLFSRDSSSLQTRGADIDYGEARNLMNQIAAVCEVERIEALWTSFFFVFQFLLLDQVWKTTEIMANKLYNATNRTLEEDQIQKIFLETGFTEFLQQNRASILATRYPLSCNKLLLKR